MVNSYRNIVRIKVVAKALRELNNKVVFVGGAVVDLYADDPTRGEIRFLKPTVFSTYSLEGS